MSDDYETKVAQQIKQYEEGVNFHALPAAFSTWAQDYAFVGFREVFGVPTIYDLFSSAYTEVRKRSGREGIGRILSIGCGDGSIEIEVAKRLVAEHGHTFVIECCDLSPILLGQLTSNAEAAGLTDVLLPREVDLNRTPISGPFDVIMANHSLHHIVELESLFDYCKRELSDGGIFAVNDMIGRSGHMRWPEARALIDPVWPILTEPMRYNAILKRLDVSFIDHDCSTFGFEGIRAQDILPQMLERFHPWKFHATGGFIDVFVERGYGHGFKIDEPSDRAMIKMLGALNDILLDAGVITPTLMLAWFTKDERGEVRYRERSAAGSVRRGDPSWVRFHTEV
jgi:SAM-dependent methyltransferase